MQVCGSPGVYFFCYLACAGLRIAWCLLLLPGMCRLADRLVSTFVTWHVQASDRLVSTFVALHVQASDRLVSTFVA